jgi:hypothetical protein
MAMVTNDSNTTHTYKNIPLSSPVTVTFGGQTRTVKVTGDKYTVQSDGSCSITINGKLE